MKSFAAGLRETGPGERRHFQTPEALLRTLGFEPAQTLTEVFLLVLKFQNVSVEDAELAAKVVNFRLDAFQPLLNIIKPLLNACEPGQDLLPDGASPASGGQPSLPAR